MMMMMMMIIIMITIIHYLFLNNYLHGFLKLKGGYFSVYLLILQKQKE